MTEFLEKALPCSESDPEKSKFPFHPRTDFRVQVFLPFEGIPESWSGHGTVSGFERRPEYQPLS